MSSESGTNNRRLHVLGVSGSLRRASFNSGLLRASKELAPDMMDVTIFDLKDVPFYNGDVEAEGDPASVTALKAAVRQADAVIFATPEYNYGTSGVLKNAVDCMSRDREPDSLMGKPATIIGAGGRAGTARAQMQLRETLAETGAIVMVKPGVLVFAFSPMKFDEDGNLTDQETQTLVGKHMAEFANWIIQVGNPREFSRFACEMDIQAAQH